MNFAAISSLVALLMAIATQTNALEVPETQLGDIFDGAGAANELTSSAAQVTKKGKSTKAPSTPAPTKVKKAKSEKSGKATFAPTPAPLIQGFVISGVDPSFEIVACDPLSVEVAGSLTTEIKQGNFIIYTPYATSICSSCNPLFRKVKSISTSPQTGNLILLTDFLTISEIIQLDAGMDPEVIALGKEIMEPLFDCPHSGIKKVLMDATDPASIVDEFAVHHNKEELPASPLSTPLLVPAPSDKDQWLMMQKGTCKSNWLKKNADGRCTHSNCYVGVDGDPTNCFYCKDTCDNGCGLNMKGLSHDGKFDDYDFGLACCNHDHCFKSSTFTKAQCDAKMLDEMIGSCPPPTIEIVYRGIPIPLATVPNLEFYNCQTTAYIFYGLLRNPVSWGVYLFVQEKQKLHELTSACIAKCPSTQESGGQGITPLNIDMRWTSGTFHVDYQMYGIKDQLIISYEGETIYDTGLVSGEGSFSVSFSGSSTIVTVTMNAPEEGTEWDVTVGCPLV